MSPTRTPHSTSAIGFAKSNFAQIGLDASTTRTTFPCPRWPSMQLLPWFLTSPGSMAKACNNSSQGEPSGSSISGGRGERFFLVGIRVGGWYRATGAFSIRTSACSRHGDWYCGSSSCRHGSTGGALCTVCLFVSNPLPISVQSHRAGWLPSLVRLVWFCSVAHQGVAILGHLSTAVSGSNGLSADRRACCCSMLVVTVCGHAADGVPTRLWAHAG